MTSSACSYPNVGQPENLGYMDLLSRPRMTYRWVPRAFCGQNRWKVFSGKWRTADAGEQFYLQQPGVVTGENISVIGSLNWCDYNFSLGFRILGDSTNPPEGGVILYYNFRNIYNYASVHICISKRRLEMFSRIKGTWSTIASKDYPVEALREYQVGISTRGGTHSFQINGVKQLEVVEKDMLQGCVGIGIKYCDVAFKYAAIWAPTFAEGLSTEEAFRWA